MPYISDNHRSTTTFLGNIKPQKENEKIGTVLLLLKNKVNRDYKYIIYFKTITLTKTCPKQGEIIECTMHTTIIEQHRDCLIEGHIYLISQFIFKENTNKFRLTHYPYVIRLTTKTKTTALQKHTIKIHMQKFRVQTHGNLQLLANTKRELPGLSSSLYY